MIQNFIFKSFGMGKSSPKEDWCPFATKYPRLRGKFLCGYIDQKKTNLRRCIACNLDIRCKNGVTSHLLRHVDTYVGSSLLEIDEGQRTIKGQPSQTIPD